MNHQYWLTKSAKKLQRKFNAKEDENIVASDNELDSKLELFKSINESTAGLTNIVEKYKDAVSQLSSEQQNLGSFLRNCGKNSASSASIMQNSGKVICYMGQQHFSAVSSLVRSLQELNTFKRAISDTKDTIQSMEKERTEYRAALALMKNCSADIDPDSGRGLEKFRTSQKYVKFAKQKFDKLSLACLQKIDLLAAARCNLFSYSLASYQQNWITLVQKNLEVLEAHIKMIEKEPRKHNFGILKDLAQDDEVVATDEPSEQNRKLETNDDDQKLFFGEEFSDRMPSETKQEEDDKKSDLIEQTEEKLIDYEKDFDEFMSSSNILLPSQLLMDDSLFSCAAMDSNINLLSSLTTAESDQTGGDLLTNAKQQMSKNPSKKSPANKWFELFSDLDPLNQQNEVNDANKNLHAA